MVRSARRDFLRIAGAALASAALPSVAAADEAWSSGSERPAFRLPEGAIDCHMHIYDDRFPVAPGTTLRPPNATVAQYRSLQARLGVKRNVVVTPSTYGTDNRCTLAAIAQFGDDARGVAVVDSTVSDDELRALDRGGIRAIRFNLSYPGATTLDMLAPLAARIADLEWHIELVVQGARLPGLERHLATLPCPLVIDHIAHVPQPGGLSSAAFRTVQRLVEKGNTWVTLSGPYVDSKTGAPAYEDVAPVAKALIDMAPERMLWGTDWPHPTQKTDKPDDASMLDVIAGWIGRPDWQRLIFATNPTKLYRFG
ncbi:amidohydrolase family protein [Burkholderia multivorans]|uniref:amidohydrolase family protein n=1 Tax=Burkholderia multivorans TaxID=87883 RepID=UPI000CFFA12F|nr:amidohydrolase family protein [Burkholderia multivorans]MBR8241323.1 amidohydrolase family protein [Burkholderia multivorans]MDR9177570.1 2-pyrone-4,6-dicarbaxylate hydrolase [Burkholderia multivorans]MDR9179254.1 2-pyrone-4,6-dicarbaxylate hydrolase [Burkholderia multivorans]MDR9186274.1 2-pyrone-4,6-dicarbaxylate hydrolase [Burkholderia multivorans]MDR9191479.1 2-pyrone-4,6-dicarbaxylate hydrolase [Burkholderia multivorans]